MQARCATRYRLGVVTNDIFTREDMEFLVRSEALPADRIIGVQTGGCPHTAIREDASMNFDALDEMAARHPDLDLVFLESGGDNLAASFSPELVDASIYVIDVSGGDKIPRKGGPGVTRSDLLVINKIDLAPHVGADLDVMARDAQAMRGERPFVFTNLKSGRRLAGRDRVDSARAAVRDARPTPSTADRRSAAAVGRDARLELAFDARGGRTVLAHAYAEPPFRIGRDLRPRRRGLRHPRLLGPGHLRRRHAAPIGHGRARRARACLTSQSALQVHPSAAPAPRDRPSPLPGRGRRRAAV